MCDFTGKSKSTERVGYKIVLTDGKNKKFYSPHVGAEYVDGPVKVAIKYKSKTSVFDCDILDYAFKKDHVGRTAVFLRKKDAQDIAKMFTTCTEFKKDIKYKLGVVKATVSNDLLIGQFKDCKVVAGKHIVFDRDTLEIVWEKRK